MTFIQCSPLLERSRPGAVTSGEKFEGTGFVLVLRVVAPAHIVVPRYSLCGSFLMECTWRRHLSFYLPALEDQSADCEVVVISSPYLDFILNREDPCIVNP